MYIIFLLTVPSSFICAYGAKVISKCNLIWSRPTINFGIDWSTMGVIHWSDYTLRGWLSFICFMHFGTAVRSFYDKEFLWMKIFTTEIAKGLFPNKMCFRCVAMFVKEISVSDSVFQHLYGVWSILHALIFLQAAIYLYVIPYVSNRTCLHAAKIIKWGYFLLRIVRLVIWSLMISIGFFIVEAITGSVYVYGSSLFPFVMSGTFFYLSPILSINLRLLMRVAARYT